MKIIQICGTNGVGKTTLVKGLLSSGNFTKLNIEVDGVSREWWYDGNTAVIGKYNDRNCCGVDAGNYSVDGLIDTIKAVICQNKPDCVLFEDVRMGTSYAFKDKLLRTADVVGYEFNVLALIASLECSCNRVMERTGNPGANYDAMRGKARAVINTTKRIGEQGAKVFFIDTEKNSKTAVLNTLRRLTNG